MATMIRRPDGPNWKPGDPMWKAPALPRSQRRVRLRVRSDEKERWHALYIPFLAFLIRLDPLCRCCRIRPATEGHHPFGQLGALILCVFPFCRTCHNEKHGNPIDARAEGWIRDLGTSVQDGNEEQLAAPISEKQP